MMPDTGRESATIMNVFSRIQCWIGGVLMYS
jgi:hypothetical protein